MENFVISVNAILPMFLVMALGYGARCLGWIHREEISNINKVAFRIFLPCLLYYNVYCSDLSGSFDSVPELMAALGYIRGDSKRHTLEELDNEEKDAEMSRCNSSVDFEA